MQRNESVQFFMTCSSILKYARTSTKCLSLFGRRQVSNMWEVVTWRQLSNPSASSWFLDLLLTTFIFEKNCSHIHICTSGRSCHSPRLAAKHWKLTSREMEVMKVKWLNMLKIYFSGPYHSASCHLHLKFRWNRFKIEVQWQWKWDKCGLVRAYVLKIGVQFLLKKLNFLASLGSSCLRIWKCVILFDGCCSSYNQSSLSYANIDPNISLIRWFAPCRFMYSSFIYWVMSLHLVLITKLRKMFPFHFHQQFSFWLQVRQALKQLATTQPIQIVAILKFHIIREIFELTVIHSFWLNEINEIWNNCNSILHFERFHTNTHTHTFSCCSKQWRMTKLRFVVFFTSFVKIEDTPLFLLAILGAPSVTIPANLCDSISKFCSSFFTPSYWCSPVLLPFIGVKAANSSVILNSCPFHERKHEVALCRSLRGFRSLL